jgi:hypothetical protein
MPMTDFKNSPFESTLEIVATLRDGSIRSAAKAQREHEQFVIETARLYRNGVPASELSNASGLTVEQITRAADELAIS